MTETSQNNDRQMVTALARGLQLLTCFRAERPVLTNSDMALATGLPKSSVSRLSHTLMKLGYMDYDSRNKTYRLAPKVLSLGHSMFGGMMLRTLALPHMRELANRSESMVAIATCEAYSMLVIDVASAPTTLAAPMEVGAHMALDTTAMGKCYIASCSTTERLKIEQHLVNERGRDPATLNEIIVRATRQYQQVGYCTSLNEWRTGVTGVAVPLYIRDFGRRLILTCGGAETQLTIQHISQVIGPLLKEAASDIERTSLSLQHF